MKYLKLLLKPLTHTSYSFGLLEVLIVTTIFILFAGALISLVSVGSKNAVINKHRLQAADLGREGIEMATNFRNNAWQSGTSWSNISWPSSAPTTITKDLVPYSKVTSFNDINDYTKKVVTTVTWNDFGKDRTLTLIKYLTNWKDATAGGGGGGPGGPTVVTLQVVAGSDDAHHKYGQLWEHLGFELSLGALYAGYYQPTEVRPANGMRFQTVNIPKGSFINSATLVLTAKSTTSTTAVKTVLRTELADSAAAFSTDANWDSRFPSTASGPIYWNNIPPWTLDSEYSSPNIASIVQSVIDRPGWVANNNMVIFWDDYDAMSTRNAGTIRYAYTYEAGSAKAPKLIISYTVP